MLKFLRAYTVFALFFVLACGSSDDTETDTDTDTDGTASLTQCVDTCEHLYSECELVMVDSSDVELSQDECEDGCDLEKEDVVDCLETADCTDVDEVNACLLEGDESDDSTDDTETEEEEEDECNTDSDCGTCERCSDGSCRDCGEGPFGCYC